jgi:hypothetical protein
MPNGDFYFYLFILQHKGLPFSSCISCTSHEKKAISV